MQAWKRSLSAQRRTLAWAHRHVLALQPLHQLTPLKEPSLVSSVPMCMHDDPTPSDYCIPTQGNPVHLTLWIFCHQQQKAPLLYHSVTSPLLSSTAEACQEWV